MSYRISPTEDLSEAVRRIADTELDKAMHELSGVGSTLPALNHAVHSVRKRCKKLRGLLRLVRDALGSAYRHENQSLRDAARMLAGFRDGQVILETHDAIVERFGAAMEPGQIVRVRACLESRLDRPVDAPTKASARTALEDARLSLESARDRVGDWSEAVTSTACLRKGIKRTYKRARKAMRNARDSRKPADFHVFRKRVKYHWYHTRLIEQCAKGVPKRRRKKLKVLSDILGDAHDLAVYESTLANAIDDSGPAAAAKLLIAVSAGRRVALERKSLDVGLELLYLAPSSFVSRLEF